MKIRVKSVAPQFWRRGIKFTQWWTELEVGKEIDKEGLAILRAEKELIVEVMDAGKKGKK